MSLYRPLTLALLVTVALPSAWAVAAPAQPTAAAATGLTEAQAAQFKVLDREFDRLETFLASLPDSQPKQETTRVLDVMKKRAAGLRTSFDQTRFDEIRFEVNFEHQQMLLWLQPPRLNPIGSPEAAGPRNELTALEKSSGWQLLFDGKTLQGWHGLGQKGPAPSSWEVRDGSLHALAGAKKVVDLVTDRKMENFELSWEWRASPGANGGLKYFVVENASSAVGHEFQFGDALLAEGQPAKAPGEWNQARLVVDGLTVEEWLNGKMLRRYQVSAKEKVTGQLALASRGADASVRDLKVRELK